ncbi:bacteriocin secretion accessory protein [Streptococcus ruminantium]|uniref:bacteriocin secretion accessory protein n=1 Tax=Streptococcus ruminantium TaxID=1917441 RepID=UPI00350E3471
MMEHQLLESGEFYHRRYHNAASRVILPSFALLVFLMMFAFFAKKELTVVTRATVEPLHVLSKIQSTSNNPIKMNYLKENQEVAVGDVLVEYQSSSEQIQEEGIKKKITLLKEQLSQLELLKKSLESGENQFPQEDKYGYSQTFVDYRNKLLTLESNVEQQNTTIAAQNAAISQSQMELGNIVKTSQKALSDYKNLRMAIQSDTEISEDNAGYSLYVGYTTQLSQVTGIAEKTTLKQQMLTQVDNQISQLENQLATYRVQYAGAGAQQAYTTNLDSQSASLKSQYLTKVAQEWTSLSSQLGELEGTLGLQENMRAKTKIVANQAGIIHLNSEVEGASMIAEGTIIAHIYPSLAEIKKVKVTTYVSSKDVASLSEGDVIHFSAQASQAGQIRLTSTITSIATSATKTEAGNFFKIEAETDLSKAFAEKIRYGLEGKFVVITGEKTYFQYLVDEFLGKK